MFSLDDRSIQYPHATVERVPLCMSNPPAPDSSNPTAKLFSDYVLPLKLGCSFMLLAVRLSSYPYGQQYGGQDFAKRTSPFWVLL
jgi:hypothetical protein